MISCLVTAPEVCVNKQCPPARSDNHLKSVSFWVLDIKESYSSWRCCFSFSIRHIFKIGGKCCQSDFGVCPCENFTAQSSCKGSCDKEGSVLMCSCMYGNGGGHGLIKSADEKHSIPFVLQKWRLLWIHYFMVAWRGEMGVGLRKRTVVGLFWWNELMEGKDVKWALRTFWGLQGTQEGTSSSLLWVLI